MYTVCPEMEALQNPTPTRFRQHVEFWQNQIFPNGQPTTIGNHTRIKPDYYRHTFTNTTFTDPDKSDKLITELN